MFTCITTMKAANKYGFNANMRVIHHVGSERAMQSLQKRIEAELDALGEEKAQKPITVTSSDKSLTVGDAPVFVTLSFEVLGPGHAHEASHQALMSINGMNEARRRITDGMFSMGDARMTILPDSDKTNGGSAAGVGLSSAATGKR